MFWSTLGYYYYELTMFLKNKDESYSYFIFILFLLLYSLAIRNIFPPLTAFMSSIVLLPIIALLRGIIVEIILKKTPTKAKIKAGKISLSNKGSDQPWPGGWIYRLREPIQRFFIRGLGDDSFLIAQTIETLTEGNEILFHCPFEPPDGEPSIFQKTIEYAAQHGIQHKAYMERYGPLKRFLTGEEECIAAISVDCSGRETLEWILGHYWVGDYCCWFVAYEGDFESWAERVHHVLNPKIFSKGFKELVLDSLCILRDVEEGEALEVITDKLRREKINLNLRP